MKRINLKIKVMITVVFAMFIILCGIYSKDARKVEAAWESYDIGLIDESKYPQYKSQIQAMQAQYPNWTFKVLYTGLNWNDVINGEYVGHGGSPKSLIYDTYNGEWVCPICGYTTYDVSHRWYCASKEAISYMMDPRNSLTPSWVFQFQNLGSSAGTWDEVYQMVKGTFLDNEECINAIIGAAQKYTISPFHLISRITQEQGPSGIGTMNGYWYNGTIVYNLFNINVSGNNSDGFLAGAAYAAEHGWYTRAASIYGGAEFLRDNYLNGGQTTLYFQKYNVVDHNNLYGHQYMQNIRAANDEGNKIYKAYNKSNILNSHFEFIIPIYENMPQTPCVSPLKDDEKYVGDINSQLTNINVTKNSSNAEFLSGNIIIVEWVNGNGKVPRTLPKMVLEATDGSIKQEIFVEQVSGNNYYFGIYTQGLDKTKRYRIRVELTERMNVSSQKSMIVSLPNMNFYNSTCYITNNKICLGNYEGGLTYQLYDISLNKVSDNSQVIEGRLMAIEWINGVSGTVPSELPKMTLKSTDGSVNNQLFVQYEGRNDYYFGIYIDKNSTSKQYQLELELTEENNISKNKKATLNLPNKRLGMINQREVSIKENKIVFPYIGDNISRIQTIDFSKKDDLTYFISGNIKIKEKINGQELEPIVNPKLTIEATDGSMKEMMYVEKVANSTYYFGYYINGLDKNKQYKIYSELIDINNISTKKKVNVTLPNKFLGNEGKVNILIKDNILKYEYDGGLTNELKSLKINKTENNNYYIDGEIIAVEWVNGQSTVPQDIPKITLVSQDGKKTLDAFVNQIDNNKYYFGSYIDGIDVNKQYNLKIELTTKYNVSQSKQNMVKLNNISGEIGKFKDYKILRNNDNIYFKLDTYIGNLNSELKKLDVEICNGATFISGEIVIVEWVDGKGIVPEKLPQMRIKSTDGKFDGEVFLTPTGTNTYYLGRYIEGIDTNKEYYLEIQSTDNRNISQYKNVNVYFTNTKYNNTIIGKYNNKKIRVLGQNIKFENDTYIGNLNSELKKVDVEICNGATFISGEIIIVEWIDGKGTVPEKLPQMRIKSTDGKFDGEVFLTPTGTNTYYLGRYIEGIDTNKEYYLEIESTDNRNVSQNRKVNVYFTNTKYNNTIIGRYKDYNIRLLQQKIIFEK